MVGRERAEQGPLDLPLTGSPGERRESGVGEADRIRSSVGTVVGEKAAPLQGAAFIWNFRFRRRPPPRHDPDLVLPHLDVIDKMENVAPADGAAAGHERRPRGAHLLLIAA